jgi:hypothetical protein
MTKHLLRTVCRRTATFLAALAVGMAMAIPARAAVPPPESLLPADTLFFVTVPDFSVLRVAAKQSPGWLFWTDPAMKPFHDKFMAGWNSDFVGPLERDLGVQFDNYASLPQGQLTFAMTQNGWNGGDDPKPGLLLLLDARDKSSLLKTNLDALRQKWTENGKTIHTETVRGVPFSVVPLSSNDVPPTLAAILPKRQPVQELGKEPTPEKSGELVVGQYGSLLIVGNSLKAVEPIVAHLSGGAAPALSDNANFAADRLAQFRDAPLYYAWFNAKTLFDVIAHIPAEQPNPEAPTIFPSISPTSVLNAMGLMALKSASLSYRETHEGAQLSIYLSAPEATRQGLLKILSAAPKDANPPSFVPANVVKFSRWRLDGQKSWAELVKMVNAVYPNGLDSVINMANSLGRQKDPGFDIRRSLIGNLGDDFISYQKAPTGTSLQDLNHAPSLFLSGAANADQAVLAMKNVAAMLGGQQSAADPRDFLGRKIYTFSLPSSLGLGGSSGAASHSLYCAASGGYVAFTADVSMLEEYLRSDTGQARPLRDIPGLADAAQHVGGAGNGLFGYQNQRETMRFTFALFKNASASGTTMALFPKGVRDWLDFSLLPDYDQVAKYFNFSVYGGGATSDGLYFKAFAPRPPQLN